MVSSLAIARDAIQTASDHTDDATVHEQLQSIDEALDGLSGGDTLEDDAEEGKRLEALEHQLVKLGNHTDGRAQRHLEVARDNVDRYRQSAAPNWEE
jgi:hypothetical protein